MYSVDDTQRLVTLIGAVIAAAASVVNLWWTHRTNLDRLTVTFGSLSPLIEPGEGLYIVSQSDHQVSLSDYGFISASGGLLSYPRLEVDNPGDDYNCVTVRGNQPSKSAEIYSRLVLCRYEGVFIGAYAVSAGRSERMALGFRFYIPWWKRFFLKQKILCKPRYD